MHSIDCMDRVSRGRRWPVAVLLAAASLALVCAACIALPQAARAEAAPGQFVWAGPWLFGATDNNSVLDLVSGPSGAVYAAGNSSLSQSGSDAFVARLRTADGGQTWRRVRPGLWLAGAASDAQHNVILAGSKGGNIVVAKYRPNGTQAWARSWGAAGVTETALAVTVAPNGVIVVAGLRFAAATGKDAVVVAFGPGGGLRWRQITATAGDDVAEAVATDALSNVYVTGSRAGTADSSVWTTYRIGRGGKLAWRRNITFVSSDMFGDGLWLQVHARALYVAAQRSGTSAHLAAMKLTLNGAERWLRSSYDLPGLAYLRDAAVDARGRLCLAGEIQPTGSVGPSWLGEIVVCRADGTMAWHDEFEDPLGAFNTGFSGVVVDAQQRPLLAGSMATDGDALDAAAVVVRYQADAGIQKVWRWDGSASGTDGFGPLLNTGVLMAGGQTTSTTGQQAVAVRLKP
jgi:hypothetical protein